MMNAARDIPQPIDDPPPDDDNADRDRKLALEMMTTMQRDIAEYRADTANVIARLQRENWTLKAAQVERDTPNWLTIKLAAALAGCHEEWARSWAAEAVKAGRSNEATKTAGVGVRINATALKAAYRQKNP
jgi:hypothetical protein